jgi:hypothetical protein
MSQKVTGTTKREIMIPSAVFPEDITGDHLSIFENCYPCYKVLYCEPSRTTVFI